MSRIYAHHELKWDGLQLRLKSGRLLATVEPDSKYEGMFRVRLRNGHLTDMVNLSRAKDAAISLVLGELNKPRNGCSSPAHAFTSAQTRILGHATKSIRQFRSRTITPAINS